MRFTFGPAPTELAAPSTPAPSIKPRNMSIMGDGTRTLAMFNALWHHAKTKDDQQMLSDLSEMRLYYCKLDDKVRQALGCYVPDFLDLFFDGFKDLHRPSGKVKDEGEGLDDKGHAQLARDAYSRLRRDPFVSKTVHELVSLWEHGLKEMKTMVART
jgi:hypothetical protein